MSRGPRLGRVVRAAVVCLLALALVAPLLASDRPFLLYVPPAVDQVGIGKLPAGWSFPWFASLLDERTYASAVDRTFNVLLVLLPLALPFLLRKRTRLAAAAVALALALLVQAVFVRSEPSRAYVERVAAMTKAGEEVVAWFPPIPRGPATKDVLQAQQPPSREHLLGTDSTGRDVLVRVLFGARTSLTIGALAVLLATSIGVLLGALAGTLRGATDALVLRLVETTACFPSLLLVLTITSLTGQRSLFLVMAVLGLTGWTTTARLVRAEFLRQQALDYVAAARALGVPWPRILARHLLPNAWSPVLVTAAFGVANAILVESALAFLKLGDPSVASWGELLREGRDSGRLHLILVPGLLIFVTVTMMNLLAQTTRDRLDPRQSRG